MNQQPYKISDAILLLIFSGQPMLWWLVLRQTGNSLPYAPAAYLVCAIFSACTASYAISVHLNPPLGSGAKIKSESRAKFWLNVTQFVLVGVASGILSIADSQKTTLFFMLLYAASIVLLFYTHFLVYLRGELELKDPNTEPHLSQVADQQIAALGRIGGAATLSLFVTWLLFIYVHYSNELPNHATLFGTLFGIFWVVAEALKKKRKKKREHSIF
jgi:hypothetical protein